MQVANTGEGKATLGTAARSQVARESRAAANRRMVGVGRERQDEAKKAGARYDAVSISGEAQKAQAGQEVPEEEQTFRNVTDLEKYLFETYPSYAKGVVGISRAYLQSCLDDPGKLASLEENLKAIPKMQQRTKDRLPKNARLISQTFKIDKDGNMSSETSVSIVHFNAAKRAAELSAGMDAPSVGMVLSKLYKDLAEVKNGGGDDDTIKQVKRMIRKAQEKLRRMRKGQGGTYPSNVDSPALSSPAAGSGTEMAESAGGADTVG